MSAEHNRGDRTGGDETLGHAIGVLRRRWLILLGIVLACIGVALVQQSRGTTTYEATASVAFGDSTLSDAALQVNRTAADPERAAATNVLVAQSQQVAERVREQLGLSESAEDLASDVEVEAAENANVLEISATSTDPERAAALANAFAEAYIAFQAESQAASIESTEEDLREQLADLPPDAPERATLQASLQRLGELRAVANGNASIISRASVPESPAGLGLAPVLALAAILGLAIGLTAIFLLESLDRRLASIEDVEREYRMSALAGVPQSAFKGKRAVDRIDHLEPYRILRSSLDFAALARKVDSLLVTSAVPGEGKTTVAVDLSHAIALTGRRVVLVEMDLRRPTFAQHFDLDPRHGLTTALTQGEPVQELLVQPIPGLANLSVLPSGLLPPNPSELLGITALGDLVGELTADDALVVVDAPPLNPVADTQVLLNSPAIHAAVVVARVGSTTRDEVRRARAILDRHLLQPLGVVVTGLRDASRYGYDAYESLQPVASPGDTPRRSPRTVSRQAADARRLSP